MYSIICDFQASKKKPAYKPQPWRTQITKSSLREKCMDLNREEKKTRSPKTFGSVGDMGEGRKGRGKGKEAQKNVYCNKNDKKKLKSKKRSHNLN